MELTKRKRTGVIIGILAISLMAMGVVGVAGSLSVIAAHYNVSDTTISALITIPCIVVIVVTLAIGKLMEFMSKKSIAIIGAICFLVGGIVPIFVDNLTITFIMRGIFGVGIAVSQIASSAITADFFEGEERTRVQGIAQAAQMAGMCIMCVCAGFLSEINWNLCFWVHVIGIVSLVCIIFLIPNVKPEKKIKEEPKQKVRITKGCIGWAIIMFVYFIAMQNYSTNLSFFLDERGIGTSSASGISLAVFAVAGLIAGIVYGRVAKASKNKIVALAIAAGVVSFLVLVLAQSLIMIYIGSFVGGFCVSFFIPSIFLYAGHSVDVYSIPMAVSIVTCAQNLGQFVCPYFINNIAIALTPEGMGVNTVKYLISVVMLVICGIIMLIYGIRKDRAAVTQA